MRLIKPPKTDVIGRVTSQPSRVDSSHEVPGLFTGDGVVTIKHSGVRHVVSGYGFKNHLVRRVNPNRASDNGFFISSFGCTTVSRLIPSRVSTAITVLVG